MRRITIVACALVVAFAMSFAYPAHADGYTHDNAASDIAALKAQVAQLLDTQQQMLDQVKQLQDQINAKTGGLHQGAGIPGQPTAAPNPGPADTTPPSAPAVSLDTPQSPSPLGTIASPNLRAPNDASVAGLPAEGGSHARVGVVEFIDFESGAAGEYVRNVFPQIETSYIKTGKIRYYSSDLIAAQHGNAMFAALTAHCSADQNRYWEMRRSIFANQTTTGEDAALDRARTFGENVDKFKDCLDSGKYTGAINQTLDADHGMGMTESPVFFIGILSKDGTSLHVDKVVPGSDVYSTFKSAIDDEINVTFNPSSANGPSRM
jgi:protein-disulfide isomerase